MEITYQLKKILQEHGQDRRGIIKEICEYTKLKPYQVRAIYRNRTQTVSRQTLTLLCEYLINRLGVPREKLPGTLFKLEATTFWSTLVRSRVAICLGVRRDASSPEPRWVNAYDSYLHGALLHELFQLRRAQLGDLSLHLAPAFGSELSVKKTIQEARRIHGWFRRSGGNRALVVLGSIKSNPVSELLLADAFDARAFTSQSNVDNPRQRRCPVFVHYRQEDPHPKSCYAGTRLEESWRRVEPGIHYETEQDGWEYCPTNDNQDAALVFYAYRPTRGTLEMVLAGFSGRATGGIALCLPRLTNNLWPPNFVRSDLKLGVFVVRFEFNGSSSQRAPGEHMPVAPSKTEVIPIAERVLKRRLEGEDS